MAGCGLGEVRVRATSQVLLSGWRALCCQCLVCLFDDRRNRPLHVLSLVVWAVTDVRHPVLWERFELVSGWEICMVKRPRCCSYRRHGCAGFWTTTHTDRTARLMGDLDCTRSHTGSMPRLGPSTRLCKRQWRFSVVVVEET